MCDSENMQWQEDMGRRSSKFAWKSALHIPISNLCVCFLSQDWNISSDLSAPSFSHVVFIGCWTFLSIPLYFHSVLLCVLSHFLYKCLYSHPAIFCMWIPSRGCDDVFKAVWSAIDDYMALLYAIAYFFRTKTCCLGVCFCGTVFPTRAVMIVVSVPRYPQDILL